MFVLNSFAVGCLLAGVQQLCCWLPCGRASTALLLVVHNTQLNSFAVGYPLAGFNSFAVGWVIDCRAQQLCCWVLLAGLQQLCCWCVNSLRSSIVPFSSFAAGGHSWVATVNSFAVVALSSLQQLAFNSFAVGCL